MGRKVISISYSSAILKVPHHLNVFESNLKFKLLLTHLHLQFSQNCLLIHSCVVSIKCQKFLFEILMLWICFPSLFIHLFLYRCVYVCKSAFIYKDIIINFNKYNLVIPTPPSLPWFCFWSFLFSSTFWFCPHFLIPTPTMHYFDYCILIVCFHILYIKPFLLFFFNIFWTNFVHIFLHPIFRVHLLSSITRIFVGCLHFRFWKEMN